MKTDRIAAFHARGYFIVPAFLDPAEIAELRSACDVALDRARALSGELGHTTPKIGLLDETSHEQVDRIAAFVASPRVCEVLRALAHSVDADTMRLKDTHYYHEQTKHDWNGDWHRDSQFGRPDPEIERAVALTTTAVHVRVALVDDDRLEIVPGSHARWDTPEELRIRKGANRANADMPNAARIVLAGGDACIFHAWSIHRATYRCAPLRRTIDSLFAFGR